MKETKTGKNRDAARRGKGSGATTAARRWKLNPFVRKWLKSPCLGEDPWGEEEVARTGWDWEDWFPRAAARGQILRLPGVWVDRALLTERFACVSDRCLPRPGRGPYRCCCADLGCVLSHGEARRLRPHTAKLWEHLLGRDRRLLQHCHKPGEGDRPFWLDESGEFLSRPGERCVFSSIDLKGRIRCELFSYARKQGLDRHEIQPVPCSMFPLVLLDMCDGSLVLSVMNRQTYRYIPTWHPKRFPCLSDPSLPYLTETLAGDLDYFFGDGFAAELGSLRKAGYGLPG
ncbi:MAG: hypothetical protein RBU30_01870 [Polyangia bacterium]|jgi:hypothetical protein|nr:hypothetical protein [Polyangia bacterium]